MNNINNVLSIKSTKLFIKCMVLLIITLIASCNESNEKTTNVKSKIRTFKETQARLVGVWYDEEASEGEVKKIGYKFAINDGKLFVTSCILDDENLQKNATTALSVLARELEINKTRFIDIERPDEYYIIDDSEDLLIFDREGLIVKCEKVFFDGKNW